MTGSRTRFRNEALVNAFASSKKIPSRPETKATKGFRLCAREIAREVHAHVANMEWWKACYCHCPAVWIIYEHNWITPRCDKHLPRPYCQNPYISIRMFMDEVEHCKVTLALERGE